MNNLPTQKEKSKREPPAGLAPVVDRGPRLVKGPAPCLERTLALDLLAVLEAEAPGVNIVEIGWELAAEARRRQEQGAPS